MIQQAAVCLNMQQKSAAQIEVRLETLSPFPHSYQIETLVTGTLFLLSSYPGTTRIILIINFRFGSHFHWHCYIYTVFHTCTM